MKPDRSNYELWLIDYIDGSLDRDQERMLLAFLDENPDIKEELAELAGYSINPDSIAFANKDALRKRPEEITDAQFDLICIAEIENDLGPDQKAELGQMISGRPGRESTLEMFRKTKLSPPALVFRHKSRIKKLTIQQKVIRYSTVVTGIAAAVMLLITIFNEPVPVPGGMNQASVFMIDSGRREFRPADIAGQMKENSGITIPVFAALDKESFTGEKSEAANIIPSADTVPYAVPAQPVQVSKIDMLMEPLLATDIQDAGLVALNSKSFESFPEDPSPGFDDYVAKVFREKILKTSEPGSGTLKLYEVADAGINGLSKLFGLDMSLQRNRDENGVVRSVSFNSRLLKFNAPVKRDRAL